jgi:hypothetical protein
MDFFYDGQIRRYVTQFMRIFIGFKYQAGDGDLRHVPVMYGDLSRSVAAIIKENSENKLPTVPRISCYISGLELDTTRISDASFVSKLNIRERTYNQFDNFGEPIYQGGQGGGYTVERLMPTPFKLTMKADIWTSNTDQKLQLIEQILVLFNPSLEIQTTDNYIDWTSLSVVDLKNLTFSSRTIPQGTESEIDVCTIECEMPIYITPPAKVKRLGVVKNIIMNIFNTQGDVGNINDLVYNGTPPLKYVNTPGNFGVLLLKSNNGQANDYNLSVLSPGEAVQTLENGSPTKLGKRIDWNTILEQYEGYRPGISQIYFLQPNGFEIRGSFVVNEVDSTYLLITIDEKPSNTIISGRTTIDAIIDPIKFNPKANTVAAGNRYLILDDITTENKTYDGEQDNNPTTGQIKTGVFAWEQFQAGANDIIEYTGTGWQIVFDASNVNNTLPVYTQNLKTGIQYRWDGTQWLKSFEGEYRSGYWRFRMDL